MSARDGFTLIELLVVIAIIGILAAAAIPQITGAICRANGSSAESAIASVKTAFSQCAVDNDGKVSDCDELNSNYNGYLSDSVRTNASITTENDQLKTVNYAPVGCQYNAINGAPHGGASVSNAIVWNSAHGDIVNQ